MLNLNFMTERDRREAASIEKRRALEEERKKRIFNPRQRLIGVDNEALHRQIEEKKKQKGDEQRILEAFKEEARRNDAIALELERKEKEERERIQREINNFRFCCQRREDRREFDLNDPNWIKKQKPVGDDADLGLSSAQKFEGEDIAAVQRREIQLEQTKAWLNQQINEKHAAEKERKIADEAYKMTLLTNDQRAVQLDNLEKECRRKLLAANQKFNQTLVQERKLMEMKRKKEEQQDNTAEIYNFLTSDMLTENPEANQSSLGAGRKTASTYRGLTNEEKNAIRQTQLQQIEEAKAKREQEKQFERDFGEYFNGIQKTVASLDREEQLQRKNAFKKLAEENLRLAEEQKQRKQYLERNVYKNAATDEFYKQFNKTTR